ncbi:MAG: hypothetical protein MHM6MM_002815 [Cercozoa sp. M6MM]
MQTLNGIVGALQHDVDFSEPSLRLALVLIVACPLVWNILARFEYYTKLARTVLGCGGAIDSRYVVCYLLAAWIFTTSSFRDFVVKEAILAQSDVTLQLPLTEEQRSYLAYALMGLGQLFVISSFARLGITGTFLGDYCGILMQSRVTGFPFNVLDNPMYVGSSLTFLGMALFYDSVVGVFLTACVYLVYRVALLFEEPFTAMIYRRAAEKKQA